MFARDQNTSLRGVALGFGASVAALGGIAACLSGGWLGLLLGTVCLLASGTFGFLLFIQTNLMRQKPQPKQLSDLPLVPRPTPVELPANGPLLIVWVSPLGRVRSLAGNTELLSGLMPGHVAQNFLRDAEGKPFRTGLNLLENGESLLVNVFRDDTQTLYILQRDAAELGAAAEQLRARTDFFAGLGHDLKSPLNAIIGFADIMDAELNGPLPEPYQDYPALIRESGATLLRFVEDMLGYARSEAGTYDIDPEALDISASGEAVMRQSEAVAKAAGVKLVLKGQREVMAEADAQAIHRIWDNLVSNAIKYSPEGEQVTLTARSVGKQAVLQVTDNGPGMDAEDLARIAQPFEQGRNSRGRAGTGLGLAMVKKLVELHGGKVVIRTAPGEGTQVTVSMPGLARSNHRAAE